MPRRPAPTDPVSVYAEAVVAGRVPAATRQRLAAERHHRDVARQDTAAFPFRWCPDLAAQTFQFFGFLRHSKGEWAGTPFTLAPFQQFLIGSLFGWVRVADGLRRFRSAYVQVPRKNGKSTVAAGVLLRLGFFDGEPGAEVYAVATKKDQAKIVFNEARRMVLASPDLRARITALTNNLHAVASHSKCEPLGSDDDTLDGLNPNCFVADEVHAHKTRGVIDIMRTAVGARRQPLEFDITTPGFDRESVCYELFTYANQILAQEIADETQFVFIADIDDTTDWLDPRGWAQANPGLGLVGQWLWDGVSVEAAAARLSDLRATAIVAAEGDAIVADRAVTAQIGGSVKLDDLASLARKAAASPAAQNTFKRLRLGVWTEQSTREIDMARWDATAGPVPWARLPETIRGRRAFAGLDLASTTDICAAVIVSGDDEHGYDVVPRFWIPRERIASRKEASRLAQFCRVGAMTATEGNIVDYRAVRDTIAREWSALVELREIGYDPWNATQLAIQLQDEDGLTLLEVRQGMRSLSEPTKKVLGLIAAGQLRHGGHPVLRWMATNFAVKSDPQGNLMPDRDASADKIDGLAAIIDAFACMIASGPAVRKQSIYATRQAVGVFAGSAEA